MLFNLILGRSGVVSLVEGYNHSKFGVGRGEGAMQCLCIILQPKSTNYNPNPFATSNNEAALDFGFVLLD